MKAEDILKQLLEVSEHLEGSGFSGQPFNHRSIIHGELGRLAGMPVW